MPTNWPLFFAAKGGRESIRRGLRRCNPGWKSQNGGPMRSGCAWLSFLRVTLERNGRRITRRPGKSINESAAKIHEQAADLIQIAQDLKACIGLRLQGHHHAMQPVVDDLQDV